MKRLITFHFQRATKISPFSIFVMNYAKTKFPESTPKYPAWKWACIEDQDQQSQIPEEETPHEDVKEAKTPKFLVSFELISKNQMVASWKGKNQELSTKVTEVLASVPFTEEISEKKWKIPLFYHNEICKTLKKLEISIDKVPTPVVEYYVSKDIEYPLANNELVVNEAWNDLKEIPEKLNEKLYTFQRQGIEFAINRGGRCLIAYLYFFQYGISFF